ncbi:MAG: hypothetical protein WA876_00815 [Candidatus Acidiferrales bacterium]
MFEEIQDQKTRSTEDYWAIVRRQRWLILGSIFVCWLVVWGIGWLLPSSYESDAIVVVQQQQVSPTLVEPNVTESEESQLATIEEQVLNPTRLQGIIDADHLYPKRHGLLALFQPSDPVEQMQTKDIQIKPVDSGKKGSSQTTLIAFEISYTAPTPGLAQSVNHELTDLFVQENINTQQRLSQTATTFLQNELSDAQADLEAQEAKVKAYKAQHSGELPDQLQSNLQVLSGLQQQLESNGRALSGAQQQKLYLQSIVQQYDSVQSDLGNTSDATVSPSTLDKQLKDLEMELAQERSQYTDNYPDVIALKDQIEKTKELQKQIKDQIASQKKSDNGTDVLPPGSAMQLQSGSPTPIMQIQSQLKANQLEIQSLEAEQKKISEQISAYQARLNETPSVDEQLSEISRGYTESSKNYDTLRQKWQDSELASNLQQNQQGAYFQTVSPASLPLTPSAPNHLLISLGGLFVGVIVGFGLAALLEFTDVRIRKETDLEGVVSARVLVGIPRMSTPIENRRRVLLNWVERGVVVAMFIVVVAGNLYAFYRG